jgi:HAD superfamily hydrolase (TIGR01458 family)
MPIQGIIFDIDGVLTYQGDVYPGAVELIDTLRGWGLELRFLTNSTLKSRRSAAEKLRQKGFDIRDGEALTASSLAASYLRSLNPRSAWVMLEREGLEEFAEFTHDEDDPEYIVIGDNRSRFDFDNLNKALRLLKKGSKLIGMTSELIDSSLGELELNVGSWVHMLELASGVEAVYVGKPYPYAFDAALQTLGLPPEQVLMVGDRANSDILGANRCGLPCVLVRTGEYDPAHLACGARPDFTIDAITELAGVVDGLR